MELCEGFWQVLQVCSANVEVFEFWHFVWVVGAGINRCAWKSFGEREHYLFGATHVGEPVVDNTNFWCLNHVSIIDGLPIIHNLVTIKANDAHSSSCGSGLSGDSGRGGFWWNERRGGGSV